MRPNDEAIHKGEKTWLEKWHKMLALCKSVVMHDSPHYFGLVPSRLLPFCLLPSRLLPFCLLPFCLLPFRLLSQKRFFDTKTNIQATELAFSTTRGERMLFRLCLSPKLENIHTWASFIHFIHQTIAPVFVPFRFVQPLWKQPTLLLLGYWPLTHLLLVPNHKVF